MMNLNGLTGYTTKLRVLVGRYRDREEIRIMAGNEKKRDVGKTI